MKLDFIFYFFKKNVYHDNSFFFFLMLIYVWKRGLITPSYPLFNYYHILINLSDLTIFKLYIYLKHFQHASRVI
jgi:hypothetical protein